MSLRLTGGALIGWVSATWPFAHLVASTAKLSVFGRLIGSYDFTPDEVAALEPYGWKWHVLSRGVRIVHTNPDYPEKIVFWCFGNPERLIERIQDLGFRPSASVAQLPHREGIPFRWSFVVTLFLMWNALLFLDLYVIGNGQKPGVLTQLAVALVFAATIVFEHSTWFQALALKPGRSVSEIQPVVRLVQLVTGVMLAFFGLDYVTS